MPVVISNKTTTSNSKDRRFPRLVTIIGEPARILAQTFCHRGKDEGSRRARKSFTEGIHHTFGSSLLLSLLFVVELKGVRRGCERGL